MSEPARHYPHQEAVGRPTPAPLRDWLAAMKAATAQSASEAERALAPEPAPAWTPRVVPPPAANARVEDADIADLMAENIMLKARLRIEAERLEELEAMVAEELRGLRAHVDSEMAELTVVRADRDLWMARAEALAQPLFQKR